MNLTKYRKEFSIFVYDENLAQARYLRETLWQKGYEAHFYSSRELLKQAIYLALPHIVVLPYQKNIQDLLQDIQKMSREIQIFIVGSEGDFEAIHRLVELGLAYDYCLEPVKFTAQFVHRIDSGVEKWLISLQQEQVSSASPAQFILPTYNEVKKPMDSLLLEVLSTSSDEASTRSVLASLQKFQDIDFVYLKFDLEHGALCLQDVASGMLNRYKGLGISLSQVEDLEDFLKSPSTYKVWSEFFLNVFKVEQTEIFPLKNKHILFGCLVALKSMKPEERDLTIPFAHALQTLLERNYYSRLIFDHMPLDLQTLCLNNKHFYENLNAEISRSRRLGLPVSCISFEIQAASLSEVKKANLIVAKVLKRFTRVTDFVGRISDRRLAVAFPHTHQQDSAKKASKLLSICQTYLAEKKLSSVKVTAGISSFPDLATDAMSLLASAEEAAEQAQAFEVVMYTLSADISLDLQN